MKFSKTSISIIATSLLLCNAISACGVLPRIPLISSGAENGDAGDDTFLQAEDAENRATELGCSGAHEHLIDGKTWYMPCSDHAEWMRLTGDNHDHDDGSAHVTDKESTHHDHDHDHGNANMMEVISPDQADVLIEIEFRDGEVTAPANRVSSSIGDRIAFAVVSDVDEFIHVHGVDFMGVISSSSSTNYLGFTMETAGIFEVEFENSGAFIIELLAD
jgi:hypothetical protein